MVQAAEAGISPLEFYAMTVGEVLVVIEGHHERERQNLISRISAILRAFQKKGDPYKGLNVRRAVEFTQGQVRKAASNWLWRPE